MEKRHVQKEIIAREERIRKDPVLRDTSVRLRKCTSRSRASQERINLGRDRKIV